MVSLPKDWIKSNELSQGDTILLVREPDGSLKILPEHLQIQDIGDEIARISRFPMEDEDFLRRYIYAHYILGVDQIQIVGEKIDPKIIGALSEIVRELVGMEIISVSSKEIVIRCLTIEGLPIEEVLRRLAQLIISMYSGLKSIFKERDLEVVNSIVRFEKDADRLYLLAVRQENKILRRISGLRGWDELRLILGHRLVAKYLEEIGDNISAIAHYASHVIEMDVEQSILDDLIDLMKLVFDSFEQVTDSFFAENLMNSEMSIRRFIEIENKIVEFIKEKILNENLDRDISLYLRLVLENLHSIVKSSKSIGEIAFNRSTRVMLKELGDQKV